jgi:cytochrome c peroxidase
MRGAIIALALASAAAAQNSAPAALLPAPAGLPVLPVPADNPQSPAKIRLGERLFFETRLSGDGSVSCASCHDPQHGFARPEPLAVGIRGQKASRNAPSLLNRAYGTSMFWDGRASSLEEQALQPIQNKLEMDNTMDRVLRDLRQDVTYLEAFAKVFDPSGAAAPSTDTAITIAHVAQAIASFERTLLAGNSPVDQFQGGRHEALTAAERRGMWVFEGRGKCWQCHSGPNYTDEAFHNTGYGHGNRDRDPGRFAATGKEEDRFRFKTPTLRGLVHTAPYMHDGGLATLEKVVAFYAVGGEPNDPHLDPRMEAMYLEDQEQADLVAFLEALSR